MNTGIKCQYCDEHLKRKNGKWIPCECTQYCQSCHAKLGNDEEGDILCKRCE